MVLEFLQNFSTTDALLIVILLILFIIFIKKLIQLIKNVIIISIACLIFPIIVNRFLGFSLPTDLNSLIGYVTLGLAAYVVYTIVKTVYSILKIGSKILPKGGSKKGKKEVKIVEKIRIVEKPQPAAKQQQYASKPGRGKSEKELFKNYVEIKDRKERKKLDKE